MTYGLVWQQKWSASPDQHSGTPPQLSVCMVVGYQQDEDQQVQGAFAGRLSH